MQKINARIEQKILRLAGSMTQRELSTKLKVPLGTINRVLAKSGTRSALSSGAAAARHRAAAPAEHTAVAEPPQPAPAPNVDADIPEAPPDDTPLEELNRWLERLTRLAAIAEDQRNLAASASIAAKVTALMALKHRLTPLPPADPNEDPEFRHMAAEAEERLLRLVDTFFQGSESWPVCPACNQKIPQSPKEFSNGDQ
jgi:hypothetical protein